MKLESLDLLLRLAYVEGTIDLHGAYERAVESRAARRVCSKASRARLLSRLEEALADVREPGGIPLTVGSYLRKAVGMGVLSARDVQERLGLPPNTFHMMEWDRISPLNVPKEAWGQFRVLFRIPIASLEEMLRRTHRLVFFSPCSNPALGRVSSRITLKNKRSALEMASRELYTRAELPLPPGENARLVSLFSYLRKGCGLGNC